MNKIFKRVISFQIILMLLLYVSGNTHAAITIRGAEQNAITTIPNAGINHVGTGTSDILNGCGSITPTTPAGSIGDILIALVLAKESSTTIVFPGSWNSYFSATYPGPPPNNNELQVFVYWRIADGSASDTFTVTQSVTCSNIAGQISRFSNVDTASPFETVSGAAVNQDSGNLAATIRPDSSVSSAFPKTASPLRTRA